MKRLALPHTYFLKVRPRVQHPLQSIFANRAEQRSGLRESFGARRLFGESMSGCKLTKYFQQSAGRVPFTSHQNKEGLDWMSQHTQNTDLVNEPSTEQQRFIRSCFYLKSLRGGFYALVPDFHAFFISITHLLTFQRWPTTAGGHSSAASDTV